MALSGGSEVSVGDLLHGDDPEVVLLPAPDQEGLVVVEEDAPPGRPVLEGLGRLQEAVALLWSKSNNKKKIVDVISGKKNRGIQGRAP